MIRLAVPEDGAELLRLNEEFNGPGDVNASGIAGSLAGNPQELVVVAEGPQGLRGFVCVQVKRSFCYERPVPEITEVYVEPESRGQGLGTAMLKLAQEAYIRRYGRPEGFELLTGEDNLPARALYERLGFRPDGELHLFKGLEGAEDEAPLAGR